MFVAVAAAITGICFFGQVSSAAVDADSLKRNQLSRDALFRALKAAASEYSFDYVVVNLPAGTLPGIRVSVPVSHVRYSSTVFFAFNSAQLETVAEPALLQLANVLRQDKTFQSLLIVGHTDSVGPDDYNARLSLGRAASVAQKLREFGIGDEVIRIIPMGESQPMATNSAASGRMRNRRVEFFISDVSNATTKAIELIKFNPCHRNDHELPIPECDPTAVQVPVLDASLRARSTVAIGRPSLSKPQAAPMVRSVLPNTVLTRPSLKELQQE